MTQRADVRERDTFSSHVSRPIEDQMSTAATPAPAHDAASTPISAPRAPARLEGDPRDGESAEDATARHGRQVARHHAGRRLPDDHLVRADRWAARGRGEPRRRRTAGRLGPLRHRRGRAGAGARREQHDQRLLRHDERRRHRRLRPGALRAAPDPVGLGDEAPARDRDPPGQRGRRRDHAVPRGRARTADHRVRAGRAVHLGVLRRAADPAQAPRARRARRVPRRGVR